MGFERDGVNSYRINLKGVKGEREGWRTRDSAARLAPLAASLVGVPANHERQQVGPWGPTKAIFGFRRRPNEFGRRRKPKTAGRSATSCLSFFAEDEGFEPPDPCGSTVFKTAAIDHSANPPKYVSLPSRKTSTGTGAGKSLLQ